MKDSIFDVSQMTLSETLNYEDSPVLSYQIEYPQFCFKDSVGSPKVINCYYQEKAGALAAYCGRFLYPKAVQDYRSAAEHGYPFPPYQVVQKYHITRMDSHYLSLFADKYVYIGGAHGSTVMSSNVWDTTGESLMLLKDFFPNTSDYQELLIQGIIRYIAANPENYFENFSENVKKTFNPNNFYLDPRGIVIFFQQYDIAPYSSGNPKFLFPIALPCPGQD